MLRGELFSTDMVRAYLEGRKKHTCRPCKGYAAENIQVDTDGSVISIYDRTEGRPHSVTDYAKHRPGDYIYCRETWRIQSGHRCGADVKIEYKAGGPLNKIQFIGTEQYDDFRAKWDKLNKDGDYNIWRPSIHMPREAARLFFRVAKVEVMRLEDVTEEFAREDGFQYRPEFSALVQFKHFWRQTYGPDARWMWVYWTEACSREEAMGNAGGT